MRKRRKGDREQIGHADETKQRALELVEQIRVSLEELTPLIAGSEEERDQDAG